MKIQKTSLILTLIMSFMLSLPLSGQNFSSWTHTGQYHLQQCYGIMEMSDGTMAVKEAVFDTDLADIGFNIYKLSPEGELIDSLFIENNSIGGFDPMIRHPHIPGRNIDVTFYSEGVRVYFKATHFTDDLEVVEEKTAALPEDCTRPSRFLVDNDEIICMSVIKSDEIRLFRLNLDGEVLKMSGPITKTGARPTKHCLFVLSRDPLRYGYMTETQNVVIEVYDEDFVQLSRNILTSFDGWKLNIGGDACSLGDGCFYIHMEVENPEYVNGIGFEQAIMVAKFNADMELVDHYLYGQHIMGKYPEYLMGDHNLLVTENSVYTVNTLKKAEPDGHGSKTMLCVTRLDNELNHSWDMLTPVEVINDSTIGSYGLAPLSNGGVAISGWKASVPSFYNSKDIYAYMFDNYLSSPEQAEAEVRLCYPNPSSGMVSVVLPEGASGASVELFSLDGRLVMSEPWVTGGIDISRLATGIYIMRVATDNGVTFEEKVVRE